MNIVIELTGTRPMLMHSSRLANPLDPYTRALKPLAKKRNKTDEDLFKLLKLEARGGCWETEDHKLGLPNATVFACLREAARAFKRGKDIERGMWFEDTVELLLIDGKPVDCDKFLEDEASIYYVSVVINRRRVMRSRAKIPTGWVSRHTFEILPDVLDARDLEPILERAGLLFGVGDRRPIYGRFDAKLTETE